MAQESSSSSGGIAAMSQTESLVDWIVENKLKAIGYTWLTGIGGSLAYQWSRPIPASLKVIHSRVYAQAITLGALGAMAGLEAYHRTLHPSGSSREEDAY
mmetsp:Transcript_12008/g.24165  ORF Transcript_12008/g.24165 Transcript_12008/m.24165 type:complete len:100 (-) Transcript_12008:1050-1349(-)